jgi:hypothetical protein
MEYSFITLITYFSLFFLLLGTILQWLWKTLLFDDEKQEQMTNEEKYELISVLIQFNNTSFLLYNQLMNLEKNKKIKRMMTLNLSLQKL